MRIGLPLCRALFSVAAASAVVSMSAAQRPAPTPTTEITIPKKLVFKTNTQSALFPPKAAPVGSPATTILCIDRTDAGSSSVVPVSCTSKPIGDNGGSDPSTQCGTSCTTDPNDSSTMTCTYTNDGCYPTQNEESPDPVTQCDPDSGTCSSPTGGASSVGRSGSGRDDFCQLVYAGLENSCKGVPVAERAGCTYIACQKASTCQGQGAPKCIAPPTRSGHKSLNESCQIQYESNMSYCSTQTTARVQSVCMTTTYASLAGCTRKSAILAPR
jgi:hypothetical protein